MNLRLLQIADSALPIGGYTHSWGLEGAVGMGLVRDAESLEHWTRHWLRTALGPLEGVIVASSCRLVRAGQGAGLVALNRGVEVAIVPASTRHASREMGEQLLALGQLGRGAGGALPNSPRTSNTSMTGGTTAWPLACWARSRAQSLRTS